MFNAYVNLASNVVRAVNKDKERRLDNENKLWFEERVARRDEDEQIIERVGGGGGSDDGTLRLRWIEVPPVLEIEISREQSLERVASEQSLEIEISGERPLEISL